jgi:AcrR family transcriptional regulator
MSPRKSAAEAEKTRDRIAKRAVELATVEGLEGLTIGRLAEDLGMSKAGVIGHFGSKEGMQMATVEEAGEEFGKEIWDPAAELPKGLERLLAIIDLWIDNVSRRHPGGCFWTAASMEMDGREGMVRDQIAKVLGAWHKTLGRDIKIAQNSGEIPEDADPDQIAFEIRSLIMGLTQEEQLFGSLDAPGRARAAARRALGIPVDTESAVPKGRSRPRARPKTKTKAKAKASVR